MMLFGVASTFIGLLIMWQFSLLVGVLFVAVGLFLIGKEYTTQEAPRSSGRDYSSEAPSYNISSKPRR